LNATIEKQRLLFRFYIHLVVLIVAALPLSLRAETSIIFDTDMDTDCDDAGALAMLHALADQGKVKILATVISSKYPYSAMNVQAINAYFKRPDVPVGVLKGKGASTKRGSKYARAIAEKFPGKYKSNEQIPDARNVYRRVLAAERDGSVVIVSVGYLTNLKDLLETPSDAVSSLNGIELVRRKVKYWVCMGGAYPERLKPGGYGNFMPDPQATVKAVRDWPGTIYFSGDGRKIQTGTRVRKNKESNPVKMAYDLYLRTRATRPSWDQVALFYAVAPGASYWKVTTRGHNQIFEKATNRWNDEPDDKRHNLVTVLPEKRDELTKAIDELMAHEPGK